MVLVFVAIIMVALLGMAAIAIDLGSYWQAQRQAQAAADAAVLAALQDLPNGVTATATATTYADKNFKGSTPNVVTPYKQDSNQIKVTISKKVPSILGGVFGIGSTTVSASAAAKRNQAYVPAALFAGSTSCSGYGITFESNNAIIQGGTHSNGHLDFSGNSNNAGDVAYGGPNACPTPNLNGNQVRSLTRDPATEPWPKDYGLISPTCTQSAATYSFSSGNLPVSGNLYCASGQITISAGLTVNNVSFKAASFSIGSGASFSPYVDDLLFWQTGTGKLSLNNVNLGSGTVFAPAVNAVVSLDGNVSTSGFIEADQIDIPGQDFTMTGTGPPVVGSAGALTE